jgi:prepilin peptidase CpaA
MAPGALLAFDAVLLTAAGCDLQSYRIPNALPALLALAGLTLAFPASPAEALSRAAALGVVVLVAGAVWLRGRIGGGDLKLLMAAALWIPLNELAVFLLAFGLASGLQGLAAMAWLRLAGGTSMAQAARSRLPLAASIGAAGLFWSIVRPSA